MKSEIVEVLPTDEVLTASNLAGYRVSQTRTNSRHAAYVWVSDFGQERREVTLLIRAFRTKYVVKRALLWSQ